MTLSTKIVCASLSYQRLDEKSINNLKKAHLDTNEDFLYKFKEALGLDIDSLVVIEKCNAVMVLISHQADLAQDYVRGRILSTWDSYAEDGIMTLIRDIKLYDGIDAIKYLGECAAGIHSVTIGDSQVQSQIIEGLRSGICSEEGPFELISDWLVSLISELKLKTALFEGNTSVERIASELILQNMPSDRNILLIGYGKSAKLVSKILNREHGVPLSIINRSAIDLARDNLGLHNVKTYLFSQYEIPEKLGCVCIALPNNRDTVTSVNNVISKIQNIENILIVDISTPSFITTINKNCINIQDLSEHAQKNLGLRKNEVSKAKVILHNQLEKIIHDINQNSAKLYIRQQRQSNFKRLDKGKLELIKYRNEMYIIIRRCLDNKDLVEVTTPYIVGISTDPPKVDGGSTINVEWMNGATAFLRQSNQIYKQILVASGIDKVYEIGPFWRKEAAESYRHLQESIGLDIELKEPEKLENLYFMACEIIKKVNDELIGKFGITSHLVLPEINEIPVLTYTESVRLLQENGNPVTMGDDLGLVSEAKLGKIIKNKFKSDIFVIRDYPDTIKKFYTKNKEGGLTETFDVIVDGWELVSGAIRQTDGESIRKSMLLSGLNVAEYEFYISIVDKAIEHGGFCIGLDRLIAKIMNIEIVSDAVPFPRTYRKLIP